MALHWRRSTDVDLLKRSYWQHYFAGLDMSSAWRTTGYTNRSSLDSCCQANAHSVVLLGVTRIQSRPTWRGAVCDPSHWAPLHLILSTEAHHMPVGHRVIWEVAGCRAGQEMGSSQAAGHQHHRHGLAMQQMQQDCSSRTGLFTHRCTHRWRNPSYSTVHSMCMYLYSYFLGPLLKLHIVDGRWYTHLKISKHMRFICVTFKGR